MGAEIGATTSLFPFNARMQDYLQATKRSEIGDFARAYANNLHEDEGAEVRAPYSHGPGGGFNSQTSPGSLIFEKICANVL